MTAVKTRILRARAWLASTASFFLLPSIACLLLVASPASSPAAVFPLASPPPQSEAQAAARRGISAYLGAKYAEALPDLEKARDEGAATGQLLYMLGFCYDAVRHDSEASSKAYTAAQEMLEKEVAGKDPSLESYFYLSNLYLNRQNLEQSKKTAEAGAAAIESKRIKVGKDGTSLFRAGKLYADAGKTEPAVAYHRRAVAAFKKETSPPPEYFKRALETVARADLGKGKPAEVADTWEKLLSLNPRVPDGDWNLGMAALRAGRYSVAREAFERAKKMGGDKGEDAFYCAQLSLGAQELVKSGFRIPTKDADGKSIAALDTETINKRIKEYSKKAVDLISREPKADVDYLIVVNKKGRKAPRISEKLRKEIGDLHRYFVALVSEIVGRGLPLQARAFEDGYASLVIHDWPQLWSNAHVDLREKLAGREGGEAAN